MCEAEQKLELISLVSSCFLKVDPVLGSGDTRTFKTHKQMTHLPLEVAKSKVVLR